jgi:hypothetical protein
VIFWKKFVETFLAETVVCSGFPDEIMVALNFLRDNLSSQHFLYFFPEPQGQGSLRPTLFVILENTSLYQGDYYIILG